MQIITGFHAIEELLRSVEAQLEKKNSETKSTATKDTDTEKTIGGGKAVANGKAAVSGKTVGGGRDATGGKAAGLRLKILYAKQGPRVKKNPCAGGKTFCHDRAAD